jgi:DNA gyrase subunit B
VVLAPIIFTPVATKSVKTDDGTSAAIISSYTAKDLSVLEG